MNSHDNAGSMIATLDQLSPQIADTAFVAPGAVVIGDVTVGDGASIWYGCVLRGDEEAIEIGAMTNIQDGSIIHSTNGDGPTLIGAGVTIGHRAVLHGCRVHDGAMIGIGAIVLDGAVVERGAIVAAGAVVTPRTIVAAGQLWSGCPARPLRATKPSEQAFVASNPEHYRSQAARHTGLFAAASG